MGNSPWRQMILRFVWEPRPAYSRIVTAPWPDDEIPKPGFSNADHLRSTDIADRRRAHLAHGQRQLRAQNFQHALDAFLPECRESPNIGSSDAHALRAQ